MRKLLAATALSMSLILANSGAAHAIIVEDIAAEVATLNTYLTDAKIWVQDQLSFLRQGEQLLHELQTDFNTAQMLWNLAHNPSLGALMGVLGMVGLSNELPLDPYALSGLISGYGGIGGVQGLMMRANLLTRLVPMSYSADQVYTCASGDFGCSQSANRAAALAGQKSALMQLYSQITDHTKVLQSARDSAIAASASDVPAIGVQVGTEQAHITGLVGQVQIVNGLAEAQRDVLMQQVVQQSQQETDGLVAACRARGACR